MTWGGGSRINIDFRVMNGSKKKNKRDSRNTNLYNEYISNVQHNIVDNLYFCNSGYIVLTGDSEITDDKKCIYSSNFFHDILQPVSQILMSDRIAEKYFPIPLNFKFFFFSNNFKTDTLQLYHSLSNHFSCENTERSRMFVLNTNGF